MKKFILVIAFVFIGLVCNAADYSSFKLDNGHNVVIQEVHDNPIVIIDTWIKTGSINETDENNGVAHFLEHLFFKGTSKHPAKEFDQILESKGAITNAATSKDYTHYYILIPSQYFELALDLHSDMLLNPLIPRKELEKERKVVIEEISKNNDRPTTVLYRNMVKGFYKVHPYKRDVIGTKEVIETISREQILDFYNTWYTPQNMTTVVIGDVDTQKALDLIKTKFNKPIDIAEKKSVSKYRLDKKPSAQIETKAEMNVETGYILIGFKGCHPITSKDSYALDVLATILGEGKSSRLYKNIKEQKQLVHSISASHSSMRDDSIFYVSANYITEDIERLKDAIFTEIEELIDIVQRNSVDIILIKTNTINYEILKNNKNLQSYLNSTIIIVDSTKDIIKDLNVYSYVENSHDVMTINKIVNDLISLKTINKYLDLKTSKDSILINRIEEELRYLEMKISYRGVKYLIEAICILYNLGECYDCNLEKDIYPIIAKKYHKKISNIKSNINYTVNILYLECKEEKLLNYINEYSLYKQSTKRIIFAILNNIKKVK